MGLTPDIPELKDVITGEHAVDPDAFGAAWVSPHDGMRWNAEGALLFEMQREMDGNPTPRSGRLRDPRRGEA